MKNTGFVLLAFALSGSLFGQSAPNGTAGDRELRREPRIRQLSHGIASTRVPVNLTGCGVATIDGVLSPGEWSGAATETITVNGATGPVTGTLYVMNDNLNLYIAFKFPESVANLGSLGIEFDNNNNGIGFEEGDDVYVANNQEGFFDDYRTMLPPCAPGDVCGLVDTATGGTNDGQSAYANDGTNSVYETSHPLNSGDSHDFALLPSQTVGFFIELRIIDGAGNIYDTDYPGIGVYDQITVGLCAPPALSGCGTPTLDGIIASGEWDTAGQYRLSVNTPHRGSTPATLYVMNDAFNLYTALAFDQNASLPGNSMDVSFDTDHSNSTTMGDDMIGFNLGNGFFDGVVSVCGAGICGDLDTAHGGTADGAGAFNNDGTRSAYELSHPLSSGDINDVSIGPGGTIPLALFLRMIDASGVFPDGFGDTDVPYFRGVKALICDPSAVSAIADIGRRIDSLTGSGALSGKNADMLRRDLSKAREDLQAKKNKPAANELGNFISDVKKMMRKGDLSQRNGQPLINAANSAMSQLL